MSVFEKWRYYIFNTDTIFCLWSVLYFQGSPIPDPSKAATQCLCGRRISSPVLWYRLNKLVWSESLLGAQWVAKDPRFPPAKTLIRPGGCPGWSEPSLGAHCWFCHAAVHIQTNKNKAIPSSGISPLHKNKEQWRFTVWMSRLDNLGYSLASFICMCLIS